MKQTFFICEQNFFICEIFLFNGEIFLFVIVVAVRATVIDRVEMVQKDHIITPSYIKHFIERASATY